MSLTNPNTVVTEQRLSEFYQGILPYMGGMPEMLANKFSKGDLYSTEERMIGQWIDGKPLYQRTFEKAVTEVNNSVSVYANILAVLSIDKVVSLGGYYISSANAGYSIPIIGNNSYSEGVGTWITDLGTKDLCVLVSNGKYPGIGTAYVTIQYTKTTDSPISIGSDTDYSTEEKIIGTWIDGKPIYQKTINFGALPNATTREVAHNISNLGHVVDIRGTAYTSTGTFMPLPLMYPSNEVTNDTMIQVFSDKIIMKNLADRSVYSAYVTLQYTKAN